MIGTKLGAIILSTIGMGSGLPSLHIAMEIISNYDSKNTGDYLRANVMSQAVIPGMLLIKEHMTQMEEANSRQEVWLIALTAIISISLGLFLLMLMVNRSLKDKKNTTIRTIKV